LERPKRYCLPLACEMKPDIMLYINMALWVGQYIRSKKFNFTVYHAQQQGKAAQKPATDT